ncbi:MAG: tetratricopeptide repeat protein [Saprospiraceae bacterium]|nr:tetratricopeptide repeat protein [Saprospiraceae bacterium]
MRNTHTLLFLITTFCVFGQPNCEIYNSVENQNCYKACKLAIKASDDQGSKESQIQFDEAIALCPNFDWAYFEKSVPYVKRGEFLTWIGLIDQAVKINPIAHLGYRGWCKYQFIRDYNGALADLTLLSGLVNNIGYSQNGQYHLDIVKALCYKGLGNNIEAIKLIEQTLSNTNYSVGFYDYLHLGVAYLKEKDYDKAKVILEKQLERHDYLAETYFYLALIYTHKNQKDKYEEHMKKAKEKYLKDERLIDPYTIPMDKVYLKEIEYHINLKHNEK